MRQETEQEYFAHIIVNGANKPVAIAANIEYRDRITAGYTHLIRRAKASAQVGKMSELLLPQSPAAMIPNPMRLAGAAPHKCSDCGFFDNPHAYILYS